jgi:hypothetical protein
MPVRTLKTKKVVPRIKVCYSEATACLDKLEFNNSSSLLKIVLEIFGIQKPVNIIKDFFFLTYTTGLIYTTFYPNPSSTKLESLKEILLSLLQLHYKEKPVAQNTPTIQQSQELVLSIRKDLQPLTPHPIPKLTCYSFLTHMIPRLNPDLLCFALKNIEKINKMQNVFTVLLNESAPYLPDVLTKPAFLVLDLDETLVHFDKGRFLIRPGCCEFIKKVSLNFELVLFTSAEDSYANSALRVIDPEYLIKFRLYRQNLILDKGTPVKDLRVLGKNLKNMIIVDDRRTNFRLQPENAIKITPWVGDESDRELVKLAYLLQYILDVSPLDLVRGLQLYKEDCEKDTNL